MTVENAGYRKMVESVFGMYKLYIYSPLEYAVTYFYSNNVIFTSALWKILDILSTWENENAGYRHKQGLMLDISAHSPSDSQHMFWNEFGLRNDYPYLAESTVQKEYLMRCHDDIIGTRGQPKGHSHGNHNSLSFATLHQAAIYKTKIAERLVRPLNLDFFWCSC